MTYGTSHFVSVAAAERYYRPYHYDDVKETVQRKLSEGEIHIGKPEVKAGQKLIVVDGGTRYAIEEQITKPDIVIERMRDKVTFYGETDDGWVCIQNTVPHDRNSVFGCSVTVLSKHVNDDLIERLRSSGLQVAEE